MSRSVAQSVHEITLMMRQIKQERSTISRDDLIDAITDRVQADAALFRDLEFVGVYKAVYMAVEFEEQADERRASGEEIDPFDYGGDGLGPPESD